MRSLQDVTQGFAALVGPEVEDDRIDVLRAALAIARTEYPDLDFQPTIAKLDELGNRVATILGTGREARDALQEIEAINQVLFRQEGFRGNREDYYDPRNSFINDVVERKLGIPITLSLVYIEVGRRVGFPLVGVGMPGHFLLKHYTVEGRELVIDVFNNGAVLSPEECQHRLDEIYAGQLPLQPEFLVSVSRRQMLTRMLNNLRSIYVGARNFRKALAIVDLVLAVYPRSPEDVKQRAMLRYQLGQMRGALADLEDYLKMSPDASDADDIRQNATAIRKAIAMMN
jgi:regulator of sirC expression with transglutaminase-like and TPR domain